VPLKLRPYGAIQICFYYYYYNYYYISWPINELRMSVPFLACLAEYQHTVFLLCFCLSYCTSCRWAAGNFLLSVNSCACTCVLRQRHSLTGFPSTPIFNAVTIVQGGGQFPSGPCIQTRPLLRSVGSNPLVDPTKLCPGQKSVTE